MAEKKLSGLRRGENPQSQTWRAFANMTPMTIKKAAEYTGYSQSYLYTLISKGEIPAYKPGSGRTGMVFLCKEELNEYIFSSPKVCKENAEEIAEGILNGDGGDAA